MRAWGLDEKTLASWRTEGRPGTLGRVVADYGEYCDVITARGTNGARVRANIAGRLRHHQADPAAMPQTGDFVVLDGELDGYRIVEVLSRRTALVRKSAGTTSGSQVLLANVDTVFIMAGLNQPLSTGRLERSLALVWDSGATPIIALTKADLASHVSQAIQEAEELAWGVPVLALSVTAGVGLEALEQWLHPGETVALLGPSGVGKSTLLNYWVGQSRQRVQAVRDEDGRGRHTTTHREIFRLDNGALIADIPGVRELGLWEGGAERVFGDIETLSQSCRFSDCQHDDEPDCAVQLAIGEGQLDHERLVHYRKMARELAHLDRKRSARAASEARQLWKQRSREARQRHRDANDRG